MRVKTERSSGGLAAFLLVVSAACATAGAQPDWIEHPERFYDGDDYMVGVGEGEDLEAAKSKALGDIASQFESQVKQVVKIQQRLEEQGDMVVDSSTTDVDTELITSGNFEGIETREKWCCRKDNHYVLVVLDKAKAKQSLTDRMSGFETEIRHGLSGLAAAETPLEEARIVMGTLEPAQQRDKLLAQYRVIAGKPWTPTPKTSALDERRRQAIDQATFVVEAKTYEVASDRESRNRELANEMKEIVNASQFKVASSGQGAMKIACTVSLAEPLERGGGSFIEYTWDASCEIAANKDGARAILVAEESKTASASNDAQAKKKALMNARKAMRKRMTRELDGYLADDA